MFSNTKAAFAKLCCNRLHARRRRQSHTRLAPAHRRTRLRTSETLEARFVLDSTVVFNEIMYHPSDNNVEWVELHNQMAVDMDLSGWRIDGGISFDFPAETVIPGHGFLVVSSDPDRLIQATDLEFAMGPFEGRLSNGGEQLRLLNNIDSFVTRPEAAETPATVLSGNDGRRVMDAIDYRDEAPWPVAADGLGVSLAKSRPSLGSGDVASWTSSVTVGGTPGVENFFPAELPQVAFNELNRNGSVLELELTNMGSTAVDLSEMIIRANDVTNEYVMPTHTLASGEFLSLSATDLGFQIQADVPLALTTADGRQVIDAVLTPEAAIARMPNGTGDWINSVATSLGEANQVPLRDEIVINEIQYHAYPDRGTPDIPPQYDIATLLRIDDRWRYHLNLSGEGLPSDWAATEHAVDNSDWLEGPGLLGFSNRASSLPVTLNTDFGDLRNNDPQITTYYFETDFEFTGGQENVELQIQSIVDDGAVFYLNGVEVHRQNMPSGPIDPLTQSDRGVSTAALSEPFSVPSTALRVGANRVSVEVHQASPSSPDMVFAMSMIARTPVGDTIPGRPYQENHEEWIELYNRSESSVDLSGWRLSGAVEFEFPSNASLAPQQYLVVANDVDRLARTRPEIAATIAGEFSGTLNNRSEQLVLRDAMGNPADEVTYFDGGRWPSAADGGGSTLELRDADADNSLAESWAASDESIRSEWNIYRYRGIAQDDRLGNDIFHELVLGLLDAGELLLDDIRVIEDPDGQAIELLQNGDFESDTPGELPAAWRLIGTHGDHGMSVVTTDPHNAENQVLHLVATGPTEDKHNQASTTYANGERLELGTEYEISFRAKWISGSNQVNTRLYFNFLQQTTLIDVPSSSGTPGAANSTTVENVGPNFERLAHEPLVPEADQPVTVTITARDSDTVASMTLLYSVNGDDFQAVEMTAAGDGIYRGVIPPQAARRVVQFYVTGVDGLGATAHYPAGGADSRALYIVQDGLARLEELHNVRIIMTSDDTRFMYRNVNRMSNHRLGATVIYDESEVFYDVGVRLKGSAFGRNNDAVTGLSIRFHPDQRFRGVHETVSIERAPNRKELVAKHMLNRAAGGLSSFYDDVARVITPRRGDTGVALLAMARTTDVYLDSLHDQGGSTPVYNLELLYSPTGTVGNNPEAAKLNFPYTHDRGRPQFEDLGDDKETYRWNFQLRNARGRDNYQPLIETAKAFSLTGQALEDAVSELIDVDQWMRTFAMLSLNGNDDVYTRLWEHNIRTYVRPEDGKLVVLPWDLDRAFQLSAAASSWGTTNNAGTPNNVAKIIERPIFERLFWGHVLDIANTTANREYMERWTDHYGDLASQSFRTELSYLDRRADTLLGRLPDEVAFEIQTNGGNAVSAATRTLSLEGQGWVNVRKIRTVGSDIPLDVTWLDGTTWSLSVPLQAGLNQIRLEAIDHQGQIVGSDAIDVTSSVTNPISESLRISEVNYHPYPPTAAELQQNPSLEDDDFEFIEVVNQGSTPISLQGVRFTDGIEFAFPNQELQPNQYAVVVRNAAAFSLRYPNVDVFGEFSQGGLNNGGENLQLSASDGSILTDLSYIDAFPWHVRADGVGATLEFAPDNAIAPSPLNSSEAGLFYYWRASHEFGGSPGRAGASPIGIVINEVLSNSDSGNLVDAIELVNRSTQTIDISGWYLSDSDNNLLKYKIPDNTLLAPSQMIVFDETDFNPAAAGSNGFALNGDEGDDVWLVVADSNMQIVAFVDDVHFGSADSDESFGRVEGVENRLAPMSNLTLNAENSEPRVGPVLITEVHYHPVEPSPAARALDPTITMDDLEFIEITNTLATPMSLEGWRVRGGIDFNFHPTTIVPAGASLLVATFDPTTVAARRLDAFRIHYGLEPNVTIVGGYEGQLSDVSDRVQLQRPGVINAATPNIIPRLYEDEVTYTNRGVWSAQAHGQGGSLQRIDDQRWGNDPNGWTADAPTPGLFESQPTIDADFNRDGQVDDQDIDLLAAGLANNDLRFDLNGDGLTDEADLVYLVESVLETSIGDSNLDGVFNSADLVQLFIAGQYDDGVSSNSSWTTGDWNGDQEFDSRDLVFAFQRGGYTVLAKPASTAASPSVATELNLPQIAAATMIDTGSENRRTNDIRETHRENNGEHKSVWHPNSFGATKKIGLESRPTALSASDVEQVFALPEASRSRLRSNLIAVVESSRGAPEDVARRAANGLDTNADRDV